LKRLTIKLKLKLIEYLNLVQFYKQVNIFMTCLLEIHFIHTKKRKKSFMYCKALFFRGGLIFAYFAENENSAKIKPAEIKISKSHSRSVGAFCMHAYCTTHTKFAQFAIPVGWNPWSTGISPFYSIVYIMNSTSY